MKCFPFLNIFFAMTLVGMAETLMAQQITLDDITKWKYSPESVSEVRPLADGR